MKSCHHHLSTFWFKREDTCHYVGKTNVTFLVILPNTYICNICDFLNPTPAAILTL